MGNEKRAGVRQIIKELRPHAIWEAIKGITVWGWAVGSAGVIAACIAFVQWLRHHWDITVIVVGFIVSFLLMLIGKRGMQARVKAHSEVPRSLEMPVNKQPEYLQKPDSQQSPNKVGKFKRPNWGAPPRDTATDANGNTVRA